MLGVNSGRDDYGTNTYLLAHVAFQTLAQRGDNKQVTQQAWTIGTF